MRRTLTVLLLLTWLPAAAAQTPPESSIEQLLEKLASVRKQRGELETQERALVSQIRERILSQQQRLVQMGVSLETPPPLTHVAPTAQPSPPPVQPTPSKPPPRPATFADELEAAYTSDKGVRQGGPDELRALGRIYSNAGEALDKARPPTVGHLRQGLDIIVNVQLKQQLPTVATLVRRHLALKLPADNTVMTPAMATACKLTLIDLAHSLEKVAP